jgi:hypothetical protein
MKQSIPIIAGQIYRDPAGALWRICCVDHGKFWATVISVPEGVKIRGKDRVYSAKLANRIPCVGWNSFMFPEGVKVWWPGMRIPKVWAKDAILVNSDGTDTAALRFHSHLSPEQLSCAWVGPVYWK